LPAEKSIPAIRTVRMRIAPSANRRKVAALAATTAEWDRAVAFYTDLFLDHPGVFEALKPKDRLTWADHAVGRLSRGAPPRGRST
jgi:hypothetical protein